MKDEDKQDSRWLPTNSTISFSMVAAAVVWFLSAVGICQIFGSGLDDCIWMCNGLALLVFCFLVFKYWGSNGSKHLNTVGIWLGALLMLVGGGYVVAGMNYQGGEMFGGVLDFLIGLYIGATGVVSVVAGYLGRSEVSKRSRVD